MGPAQGLRHDPAEFVADHDRQFAAARRSVTPAATGKFLSPVAAAL